MTDEELEALKRADVDMDTILKGAMKVDPEKVKRRVEEEEEKKNDDEESEN